MARTREDKHEPRNGLLLRRLPLFSLSCQRNVFSAPFSWVPFMHSLIFLFFVSSFTHPCLFSSFGLFSSLFLSWEGPLFTYERFHREVWEQPENQCYSIAIKKYINSKICSWDAIECCFPSCYFCKAEVVTFPILHAVQCNVRSLKSDSALTRILTPPDLLFLASIGKRPNQQQNNESVSTAVPLLSAQIIMRWAESKTEWKQKKRGCNNFPLSWKASEVSSVRASKQAINIRVW